MHHVKHRSSRINRIQNIKSFERAKLSPATGHLDAEHDSYVGIYVNVHCASNKDNSVFNSNIRYVIWIPTMTHYIIYLKTRLKQFAISKILLSTMLN